MVKFAKMQILTQELQRSIQEEAAKVPPEDVATYYKENSSNFEQFSLDRLFVPRTKQPEADAKDDDEKKDEKLTDEQKKAKEAEEKAKTEAAEQAMTQLATSLRDRAAAGEDFAKLQKEAFDAAGMKIESPTVTLPKVRRTGLPPAHAAVFDLKPGEVSQVISDSGGHYIYKVESKDQLPPDQVKDEIHSTLQNQRTREMMDKVNGSFKVETNEQYFGPAGPAMPQRMPNARMMPAPPQQAPPQSAPAAAQPQSAKPN
jgi:parvulin-like peptidyl-prolyl isomerase